MTQIYSRWIMSLLVLASFSVAHAQKSAGTKAGEDSCEFIRQGLKNAPENGTVLVPAGLFDCSKAIIIDRSNVKLIGAGKNKTTIRLAKNHYAPLLIIGAVQASFDENIRDFVTAYKVKNITVSNITFDGNLAEHPEARTRECGENHCDGDVLSPRNNAVTLRGAEDVLLYDIVTKNSISGGVVTEKFCKNLKIIKLESFGNFFDGFAGYQTEFSLFKDFYMHNNNGAGLSLDIHISRNHFKNIVIQNNKDVGVFARELSGNLFENMKIENSGNHGIFIAAADKHDPNRTCAAYNEFRNLNISTSARSAFRVNDYCVGNTITGQSTITDTNKKGCIDSPMGAAVPAGAEVCR